MIWELKLKVLELLHSNDNEIRDLALQMIFASYPINVECDSRLKLAMTIIYLTSLGAEERELAYGLANTFGLQFLTNRF